MVYLLFGADDFSKKDFIAGLEKKEHLKVLNFFNIQNTDTLLSHALNSGLFAKKNIIVVHDFLQSGVIGDVELPELVERLSYSENEIVFVEAKLDLRKSANKELLKNNKLRAVEFEIPVGEAFRQWVEKQSQKYQLNWQRQAEETFLALLGLGREQFGRPDYDLWQADSELRKLKTFAGGGELSAADVRALVSENIDEDIFRVTNAIADKNKKLTAEYLVEYLDRVPGEDEKTKIIGLSGLLADQFRSILLVQNYVQKNMPDNQIAAATGFSSGRTFVLKKLSRAFEQKKLLEALKKLEFLDQEIKTSQSPAALQFFMIIESVLK